MTWGERNPGAAVEGGNGMTGKLSVASFGVEENMAVNMELPDVLFHEEWYFDEILDHLVDAVVAPEHSFRRIDSMLIQPLAFNPSHTTGNEQVSCENSNTRKRPRSEQVSPSCLNETQSKCRKGKTKTKFVHTRNKIERASETTSKDHKGKRKTSRYRGVCWYKRTNKWVAQIKIAGVRKHIGYFDDEHEAALAYNRALDEHRLELDSISEHSA